MTSHRRGSAPRPAIPALQMAGAGPRSQPVRRCAIYTRKSTEEGLEQGFNSLDAQREACEAYILSQRHEGWMLVANRFDDGGYSGGTIARPGLQALMAAVDAGRIDVVVVYKVDRLTRALADFAKIVERFDAQGVSFVSVTQSFNTTTSMGRLTLNVLLSFAQFEREVGAERVRDKVAASRRKGMWMGGTVPMGYRVQSKKLVIDAAEADDVRMTFALYLEYGSTTALLAELRQRNIRTASRVSRTGSTLGGVPFGPGSVSYLLHNRIYIGEVVHKGEVHPGEHKPIVDRAVFEAVQEQMRRNANIKRLRSQASAILTGRIVDSAGNRMTPTHANKRGVRYRYYVTRALAEGRPGDAGEVRRVSAPEIERIVVQALHGHINGTLGNTGPAITDHNNHDTQALEIVEQHLQYVAVHRDRLVLTVTTERYGAERHAEGQQIESAANDQVLHRHAADGAIAAFTMDEEFSTLIVPWSHSGGRPRCEPIIARGPAEVRPDPMQLQLVEAIQRARGWMQELISGTAGSIDMIAAREGKHLRSIRTALTFAFLAPDIVEAIIDGTIPAHLTLTDIGRGLPMLWTEQRRMVRPANAPRSAGCSPR
jgi:site-specific DNA recombinase